MQLLSAVGAGRVDISLALQEFPAPCSPSSPESACVADPALAQKLQLLTGK
jgi:hypothetical protein